MFNGRFNTSLPTLCFTSDHVTRLNRKVYVHKVAAVLGEGGKEGRREGRKEGRKVGR
jgi:hypothetical protein